MVTARPKKKKLADILLVASLSLLLVGAAEAAVRVALRIGSGVWAETRASGFYREITTALLLYRRHPYLHTAPREGARVEAFGRQASFNSLGYRSPERPLEKPPATTRILCSGGSTTFDILADRDETSWPWRLEEVLRDRGLPAEVWNGGFPGWTSLENLISLAIRDGDLGPDLILLFQGINDLQPASHRPFDRQYERGHADLMYRSLGFELEPLAWHQKSLLLEKLRDAIQGPTNPWNVLRSAGDTAAGATVPPAEAVAVFERNLRSFAVLSRGLGARLVLVPQVIRVRSASRPQDESLLRQWLPGLAPGAAAGALQALNAVERRLASEGLADLFDPSFASWDDAHWSDPMHFSPLGSQRFAESLGEALARELASRPGGEATTDS